MREKFSPSLFQKAGGVWGNAPHKQTDKSKFEKNEKNSCEMRENKV